MNALFSTLQALYGIGLLGVVFAAGGLWIRVGRIEHWIANQEDQRKDQWDLETRVLVHLEGLDQKVDALIERVDQLAHPYRAGQ